MGKSAQVAATRLAARRLDGRPDPDLGALIHAATMVTSPVSSWRESGKREMSCRIRLTFQAGGSGDDGIFHVSDRHQQTTSSVVVAYSIAEMQLFITWIAG